MFLGDAFDFWATPSFSGRRFGSRRVGLGFGGVRQYGHGGSDTDQVLTGRPPPLRYVSWVSSPCRRLRRREVRRSGQGGSDTDQCLTGRPPPLRYVSGFPCALFCFKRARVDPTGGVPIWPGRVGSVGLQPVALRLQGAYRYPGRFVGSRAP